MAANTAAEALSQFLNSAPEPVDRGQLIDRLAGALNQAGDLGLPFAAAMEMANISRPEFMSVLPSGLSTGLIESFTSETGEQRLRLTAAGRSLF